MKLRIRRAVSIAISLLMMSILMVPGFAYFSDVDTQLDEEVVSRNEPATYHWEVTGKTYMGLTTNGVAKERIGIFVAADAGEKYYASYSSETYSELSGTIKASYASIESLIGFKIGKKETKSAGATSRALAANESVTAYGQPQFEKYEVYQKEVRIDQAGHSTDTGKTAICYAYKPLLPSIVFEYSK